MNSGSTYAFDTTNASGGTFTIADVLANSTGASGGTRGLTKLGNNTLVLTNSANTYSGATLVNAGTLLVNGTNSDSGAVTVANLATLGGTGSLAGAVSVNGTLAPGASIESLGTGALTFNNGSTFAYELRSDGSFNGDLSYVTGGLNLSGTVTLTLADTNPGILSLGSKLTLISSTDAWNGGLFTYLGNSLANNSTFTLGGNQWLLKYNDTSGGSNFTSDQTGASNFVTMQVVPEPSSLAMLLFGGAVLWFVEKRRSI
jgi:autotransporter-associated beta strand protein